MHMLTYRREQVPVKGEQKMRVIRVTLLDPATLEVVIATAIVPDDVDLSPEEIAAIASALSSSDSADDNDQPSWPEFLKRQPGSKGPQNA